MKTLFIDPFHGAAGDMIIGALLSLLSDREEVLQAMALVVAQPSVEVVRRCSITALKIHTHASKTHRTAEEVQAIITSAPVPVEVKERACRIFERIRRAESKVHGYDIPCEEPREIIETDHGHTHNGTHGYPHDTQHNHFHEVGADDAIADIIGTSMALSLLKPDKILIFPVAIGRGIVKIAHGIVPIPAPATAEILHASSLITQIGTGDGELLTPTGAAILAEISSEQSEMEIADLKGIITGIGYGAGSRDDPLSPNVIRMMVIENEM
nr:LarC family nickel insertion protein [uncultured Methanospirillum sp.]